MSTANEIDLHLMREAIGMAERSEPIKDGIPKVGAEEGDDFQRDVEDLLDHLSEGITSRGPHL